MKNTACLFVQLVLEKGEEDRILSWLELKSKQVAEELGLPFIFKKSGRRWVWQGKNDCVLPRFSVTFIAKLYPGSYLQSQSKSFLWYSCRLLEPTWKRNKSIWSDDYVSSSLTDEQKSRLLPLIEKKMSLKVRSVKEQIDESLIGGFVIFANHKTIDVSIKQQLKVVKENLK